jgi:quinoprotein glucose dehydrogenase
MKALLPLRWFPVAFLIGQSWSQEQPYVPPVAPASSEARDSMSAVVLPEGFELTLFAAEPLLANPVAFAIDGQMRFFVAETFRLNAGVTDMRSHMHWLPDELAARTVEDRVDYMRRHEGDKFAAGYLVEQERITRLVDEDGDGQADSATVYAGGFADPAAGVAAGVLPVGDDLYFACIPDMWRLWDEDGDGVADGRSRQHTGWGVHTALAGHDMHGLVRGPDGRLYWSIGDRGFHVQHEGQTLAHHHTGAVLRSELDGSGLEIFATGLRNPQDLVFDDHGNLFTGDNNSDAGDRARWVYLVEGGESGWRQAYQYVTKPVSRGPWNDELLWKPWYEGQPAYIVPPVANFADGPSGIAYYPGTGWGPGFCGSFFLCDFLGDARNSGIHRFQMEERGAGFALVGAQKFLWHCLPTDVQIGPDGSLYYSDWVHGWDKTGKGRLFGVHPVGDDNADVREQVRVLLAEGMAGRPARELASLLGHGHQTVRLEAQWELAARALDHQQDRDNDCLELLMHAALGRLQGDFSRFHGNGEFVRLHGIWGAGEVLRRGGVGALQVWAYLAALHRDEDSRVRAQWLKTLAQVPMRKTLAIARRGLADPEPRVRFFAAQCLANLGRAGHRQADVPRALIDLLEREGDGDPWLRHAVQRALAFQSTGEELEALHTDSRRSVRLGAIVALRTRVDARVGRFLGDTDHALVAEAARAIYDRPIAGAMHDLARLLPQLDGSDAGLARRAMAAQWRLHTPPAARALGDWALACASDSLGAEALSLLANWQAPNSIDPVMGEWRPVDVEAAPLSAQWVVDLGARARSRGRWGQERWSAWIGLSKAADRGCNPVIAALARGQVDKAQAVQQTALQCALDGNHSDLSQILLDCSASPRRGVRIVALRALARSEPERALQLLVQAYGAALAAGDYRDARLALEILGQTQASGVEGFLLQGLEELCARGGVGPVALELERTARDLASPTLDLALERLRQARSQTDKVLADWVWALEGGDAAAGRVVFLEKIETECLRCHAFGELGGSEVGPDLTRVGSRLSVLELLRSVLMPGATIAEGFEDWLLQLDDGETLIGRILQEADGWVTLETPQKEIVELEESTILGRKRGPSSMPEDVAQALSRAELRDLMAFLASCVE